MVTANQEGGLLQGSAYIFERNLGGTDSWGERTRLIASDSALFDLFGTSVAISGDTLVVGANNAEAAYIFERNLGGTDNWGERTILTASDATGTDNFGLSVSIDGDTVAVGANNRGASSQGAVYLYERNLSGPDNWGERTILTASDAAANDEFGYSVSLSSDTLAVGAIRNDDAPGCGGICTDSGAAYLFERNLPSPDNWGERLIITASNAQASAFFGHSVSINGDNLLVGAQGTDNAPACGGACTDSGAAYLFGRDSGGTDSWGEQAILTASDAEAQDFFGFNVALGTTALVVGAFGADDAPACGTCANAGTAYVFGAGFTVTNTNDSGPGSLRAGITAANLAAGTDTIDFAIPGAGPHTIQPLSPLPDITETVILDATTQAGTDCAAGTLQVALDGSAAGAATHGLRLITSSGGSTVQGLAIHSFDRNGIDVFTGNHTLRCNFIGTDITGTSPLGNGGAGIDINSTSGSGTVIGGTLAEDRNLIAANTGAGILINIENINTTVQNNIIGTDITGTSLTLANTGPGIQLDDTTSSTSTTIRDNLIKGQAEGARLSEATTVEGNRFESNDTGILLTGLGNTISATNNCFTSNTLLGLDNSTGSPATAENNWWGAADGPGGNGPGSGDGISTNVDAEPFLTSAPAGCLTTVPDADLTLTLTDTPDPVVAGSGAGNLSYELTLSNNGPFAANNITVNLASVLPTGVSEDNVVASAGIYTAPNWSLASLASPSSETLTITVSVDASVTPGTDVISYSATITALDEVDPVTANNSASEATSVTGEADLEVAVIESIDPVVAGSGTGNLSYTITLSNNGPSDATNATVDLSTTLPTGVTIDSVVPSVGSYTAPTWSVPSLTNGASETLTVTLSAAASTAPGTDIIDATATITGLDQTDATPANDSDTQATSVSGEADLAVTVVESIDPVVAGSGTGNLSYTITLSNNGPSDATNATVDVSTTLPTGATIDSVVPSVGSYTAPTWSVPSLTNGASETLTITLTVAVTTTPGTNNIDASAAITGLDQSDTIPANDSALEATSVVGAPLTVTNTLDSGPGSLRQAILAANAAPGLDLIDFAIPGAGPHTIRPLSVLPDITDPVVIDAESQPGMDCVVGDLRVALDGSLLGGLDDGLRLAAASDGSTIQGLVINGFPDYAIDLQSANHTLRCNFIGTDASGTTAVGNARGINIGTGADNALIGGPADADRNLISANLNNGIDVGMADGTAIRGNLIGTDVTGLSSLGNGNFGISVASAATTTTLLENLIVDNQVGAVLQSVTTVQNNRFEANNNTGLGLSAGGSILGGDGNCFARNTGQGLDNLTGVPVTVANSWWGASDGPSGAGPGSGDAISADVDVIPFLTTPPAGCLLTVESVDLALSLVDTPDPVAINFSNNLSYTLSVSNLSADDATGVTVDLSTLLPVGVNLDAVTPGAGIYSDPTWTVDVASGNTATLTLALIVSSSTTPGTDVIQLDATITSAQQVLINPLDDTSSETTSVVILTLDIDGDGTVLPLADGLLILRFIAGFTGNDLIANAVASGAVRSTAIAVTEWLQLTLIYGLLDVDGNGLVELETDGDLMLRYLFGYEGEDLIEAVLGDNPTRDDPEEIENFLDQYRIMQSGFE